MKLKLSVTLWLMAWAGVALAGATEDAIDAQINARVYTVLDSLDLIPGTPPVEPPPVDPPPVEPPDSTLVCREGYDRVDAGPWAGYCVDELRNFTAPADGSYGIMAGNAVALRRFAPPGERWAKGWAAWEFYVDAAAIPYGPGMHMGGVRTEPAGLVSRDESEISMLRPDLNWTSTGTLQLDTYNKDGNGNNWYERSPGVYDVVVDHWTSPLKIVPKRWHAIRVEWDRTAANRFYYKLTVDGVSAFRTMTIHPDSHNPCAFQFGNIDIGGSTRILYWRNVRSGK